MILHVMPVRKQSKAGEKKKARQGLGSDDPALRTSHDMNLDQVDVKDADLDFCQTLGIAKCVAEKRSSAYRQVRLSGANYNLDTELLSRIQRIRLDPKIKRGARNNLAEALMENQQDQPSEAVYDQVAGDTESTYTNSTTDLPLLHGNIKTFDLNLEQIKEQEELESASKEIDGAGLSDSFDSESEKGDCIEEELADKTKEEQNIYNEVEEIEAEGMVRNVVDKVKITGSKPRWSDDQLFNTSPLPSLPDDADQNTILNQEKKKTSIDIGEKIKTGVSEIVGKAKSIIKTTEPKTTTHPVKKPTKCTIFTSKSSAGNREKERRIKEEFQRAVHESLIQDGGTLHVTEKSYEQMEKENEEMRRRNTIKGKNIPGKDLKKRSGLNQSTNPFPNIRKHGSSNQDFGGPSSRMGGDLETMSKNILMTKVSREIMELSVAKVLAPEMKRLTDTLEDMRSFIVKQDSRIKELEKKVTTSYKGPSSRKESRRYQNSDSDMEDIPELIQRGAAGTSRNRQTVSSHQESRAKLSSLFGRKHQGASEAHHHRPGRNSKTVRFSKRVNSGKLDLVEERARSKEDQNSNAERIRELLEE